MKHNITRTRIKKISVDAGLKMGEISQLISVSRQTLYNWEPPSGPSNKLIAERAENMLAALENAISLGFLPLKDLVDKPRRMAVIKIQLAKSFQR